MKHPILLLPLDDRPVNLDLPVLLGRVAGEALTTPPPSLLGRFLTPGSPEALEGWLGHTAATARTVVLSLDMLAYGGLVASRTPTVAAGQALDRLEKLRLIKNASPGLRLFAFSVIMRLTITSADAETRAAGRDIFRYSVLRDQVERLGDTAAAAELAAVTARIPAPLLTAYLQARARNHAVNRAAVALLADGVLDFLALVQEDTAPAGLHLAEQQALIALASERAPADRWRLYAGTDEAAQTLLARAVCQEAGLAFPVTIALRHPADAEQPALFEDVPLRETVERHVDAVGGTRAPDGTTLAVHTFTPPQRDMFEWTPLPVPTWDAALHTFPTTDVAAWMSRFDAGTLAVADVAYCNGGDPHLLEALFATHRYLTLRSYAGWNTAGNTLGTTLAHAALRSYALLGGTTPAMEDAHREALFARLLDDGLYQPIIRAWASARAQEFGASPLNLAGATPHIEARVDEAVHALWQELQHRHSSLAALERPFHVTLPWGRLFEMRPVFLREGPI